MWAHFVLESILSWVFCCLFVCYNLTACVFYLQILSNLTDSTIIVMQPKMLHYNIECCFKMAAGNPLGRIYTGTQLFAFSVQGRKGNIFQRGQSHFSWFFPTVKWFFPVENSHFGRPKTNFSGFGKWKGKEKKEKKGLSSFCNFSPFHFQFSTFLFSIFRLFYSIFPCLSFPGRSTEISQSEVSGGHSAPCLLHHCFCAVCVYNMNQIKSLVGGTALTALCMIL